MKRLGTFLLICALAPLSGCMNPEIPVIGLDDAGNPTQGLVPESEYSKRLEAAVTTLHDSALPVLTQHQERDGWMLREVVLGVGVNSEIGIGKWKVGALPKFRLIFANTSQPSTP